MKIYELDTPSLIIDRERITKMAAAGAELSFGVDCPEQVAGAEAVFAEANVTVSVQVEIEVGEERSGIIEEADFRTLLAAIKAAPHIHFKGLFSHDGNCYRAKDVAECTAIAIGAQERTVHFAKLAAELGMPCASVSYGSTPTFMNDVPIVEGITELRPGTYALMDAAQAGAIGGDYSRCAATVLATVMSLPTPTRTILDVGAKGLTKETRTEGICSTPGKGVFLDYPHIMVDSLYDEHAIILNKEFHDSVKVGDLVRIIPVHICPVCNLYSEAALVSGDEVIEMLAVAGQGKIQ